MIERIPVFMLTFFLTIFLGILLLPALRKAKASQTILHYVKEHSSKQGTPTMGGIIFVLAIALSFTVYSTDKSSYALVALAISAGYGIVGFLDDYIKIRFKRNLGLRAYQKIIFQVIVATVAAVFAYQSGITELHLPFTKTTVDLGAFVIPLTIAVFIATTNCVNLTDGLDGLAGGTSLIVFFALSLLLSAKHDWLDMSGYSFLSGEYYNLLNLSVSCCAAVLGFLCFNSYPAKVFMGDTGSLALGGFIASISVFSGNTLFILVFGVMFVVSGLSVILQVFFFKVFKRRIVLMAPYHHHLQQKGHHEAKISAVYMIITLCLSLICVYFSLV